ncbi:hypothetical protein BGZ99_005895 [Dissophora globulifera]|uniref:Uncharacterized protein n=1 Tax=Dissophora globulifera TaxID=979702 RepID=A0A9P6RDY9_9FUNG|nr:hypothetical protein BGZ99_005895 [Dissophora globulifera]
MFTMEDMREWRSQRGKEPPLRGTLQAGGMWTTAPPTFPAQLDDKVDIQLMVSTASNCNVFSWEHFKSCKLHNEYPYMLNFQAYRPNVDTVTIKNMAGNPMTIHGYGQIPITINDEGYHVDAYLVDMSPQVQGILSANFLIENDLQLGFEGNNQKIIPNPK